MNELPDQSKLDRPICIATLHSDVLTAENSTAHALRTRVRRLIVIDQPGMADENTSFRG